MGLCRPRPDILFFAAFSSKNVGNMMRYEYRRLYAVMMMLLRRHLAGIIRSLFPPFDGPA